MPLNRQTMDRKPLVSVIIPVFNAEAFVCNALASIQQENAVPLEIIIINDGSTDASLERIQQIQDRRIRVIHLPTHEGIATALNIGLDAAQGEIIMRCDADDVYPAQRIARQADWLVKHPDFDAVCGSYSTIDATGQPVVTFNCGDRSEDITQELRNGITRTHLCSFAIRARVLQRLDGFRQYFCTSEDIDFQLRLGDLYRIWYLPENLYHYRIHDRSITHTQGDCERQFFELKAHEFQIQRRLLGSDDLQRGCPPVPPSSSEDYPLTAADHLQKLLIGSAWKEHQNGHKLRALATGLRSVMAKPQNPWMWRNFLVLVLKPAGKRLTPAIAYSQSQLNEYRVKL
jgi:hypothetical protein